MGLYRAGLGEKLTHSESMADWGKSLVGGENIADKFTLLHALAGMGMRLIGLQFWQTLILSVAWEVLEPTLKDHFPRLFPQSKKDKLINKVGDVAATMLGWYGMGKFLGNPYRVGNPRWKIPSEIQSLMLSRDRFTKAQAKRWAAEHGFKFGKVHATPAYFRLRQLPPGQFLDFRNIRLTEGVHAVIGPRG